MQVEASFGKRLQALRLALGYTQQDIANKLRTSVSNVSNWETDYSEPKTINVVRKLCRLLHCPADFLLCTDDCALTADDVRLLSDFNKLDDDGQHTVRAVLDSQLALHARLKVELERPRSLDKLTLD